MLYPGLPTGANQVTKKERLILFVDDEPFYFEALLAKLETRGFECICKTDMTSAVEFLRDHEASLVVTDVMMPPGDGSEPIDSSETGFHFINILRRDHPNLPVICLSVIGDQERIKRLKRRGVLFLRKGETSLDKAARLIESKVTGLSRF